MPHPNPPSSPFHTAAGWLVGLFAVWQLVFPVLANVLEFVPLRPTEGEQNPPLESTQRWGRFTSNDTLQSAVEGVGYGVAWYAQLTGQEHGWDMFTPGFPPFTVIPFAELDTADGRTVREYSRFDPLACRQSWLRPPLLHDREFNYEANLFMIAWYFNPHWPAERPGQPDLPANVRANEELLTRWLRRQSRRHSETIEVRMMLRYLPRSGEAVEIPFARLRPHETPAEGMLPVEGYDPASRRFLPLPGWDAP